LRSFEKSQFRFTSTSQFLMSSPDYDSGADFSSIKFNAPADERILDCGCCTDWCAIWPSSEAIGIAERGQCLCIESACVCQLVKPKTCCLSTGHCCCLDRRTACPCTEEIPCGLACCGIVCFGSTGVEK